MRVNVILEVLAFFGEKGRGKFLFEAAVTSPVSFNCPAPTYLTTLPLTGHFGATPTVTLLLLSKRLKTARDVVVTIFWLHEEIKLRSSYLRRLPQLTPL